jgi:Bacterial Ig-like domain (group 3)/FG-GAP-like repeat
MRATSLLRLICVLPICAALLCPQVSASAGNFKNPPIIPTSTDVLGIAVADVNHDGKPDLVYLDGTSSFAVHVLLGNGDGTFSHGQDIALPAGICCAVTVADVTGDGKLDIILQGSQQFTVYIAVLVGNGDGTFNAPTLSSFQPNVDAYPRFRDPAGVGDINGDGKADLVVCDALNGELYVLLGDGTGKFTLHTQIADNTDGLLYLLDLNGDQHLDIVATNILGSGFLVFLGNGDGTFQNFVAYGGQTPGSLMLADLDGDGHPDMLLQYAPAQLGMFKGNPDGTFAPLAPISSVSTSNPLVGVYDFNGDGIPDLLFTSPTGIGVGLAQSTLDFTPVKMTVSGGPSTVYITLAKLVAADFNGDGHLDLAMPVEGGIAILLGTGTGTFASADFYDVGQIVGAAAVADFNGDKSPDIAVTLEATYPRLLLGNGKGSFTLGPDPNSTYGGQGADVTLLAADFNGDGIKDLNLGNMIPNQASSSTQSVELGVGNGTFSAPISLPNGSPIIGDVNNDGRSDMVYVYNDTITSTLGQSNGTFTTVTTDLRLANATGHYNIGDVNHDGKLDVVINYYDHLEIWFGNGDGTFTYASSVDVSQVVSDVVAVVADLDGDGNGDIVLAPDPNAGANFGPIAILYGNGDGTFQPPVLVPVSHRYSLISVADLNGDGKPDLAMTDGGSVAILMNLGNRKFASEVDYVAGGAVSALNVVDVNGDGFPDIVVANTGGSTVTVLLNQPNGTSVEGAAVSGLLTVSPEPSGFGQAINMSLTVSGQTTGGPVPTGSVSFNIDGGFLATVALANGTAIYNYANTLIPGQHTIVAGYNGDTTYASSSFSYQHVIQPPTYSTKTTLTATPTTILASQTVRLLAHVSSTPAVPGGDFTLLDGTASMGAVPVDASGNAYFDTALLSPGTHSLAAKYDGFTQQGFTGSDTSYTKAIFAASTSPAVVVAVGADATMTAVSFSAASPTAGTVITFTAMVSSSAGVPFGGATFYDGTSPLGASGLQSDGSATFSTASLSTGTHTITATFNANGPFAGSTSSPINVTVSAASANALPAFVSLTPSINPSSSGSTLVAVVNTPKAIPGGNVTFLDGGVILGTAQTNESGIASLRVAALASGTHSLSASFGGRADVAPSVSPTILDEWPETGPGFNVSLGASTMNVAPSSSDSLNIAVVTLPGFAQPVQLSCSAGVPAGYSCHFSPDVLNAGGTSILTIRASTNNTGKSPNPIALYAITAGLFALVFLGRPSRRSQTIVVLFLLCFAGALSGCGTSSFAEKRVKTVVLTIRAVSGSGVDAIVHSAQISTTFQSPN